MTTTSTADSKEFGVPEHPVVEKGAQKPSGTQTVVNGEVAPRLPHEHDESSDSGTREPNELMHRAARDAQSGRVDEPRGPDTQRHYSDLTEKSAPSEPDA